MIAIPDKKTKTTEHDAAPDDHVEADDGHSSVQSFGNIMIKKKMTEETVVKFIEEKC